MNTNSQALFFITESQTESSQEKNFYIKNLDELLATVKVNRIMLEAQLPPGFILEENPLFPLRAPLSFVKKIKPDTPKDPLLWQILPLKPVEETKATLSHDKIFNEDPLEERKQPGHGMLQKYAQRVLLLTTGHCSIHCRYCFRQHYPYQEHRLQKHWPEVLQQLKVMQPLEVIFSGGDPFTLATNKLKQLSDALQKIESIKILRIHSREPVVNPERIDAALLHWLEDLPWQVVVVTHSNHPQELDAFTGDKLRALSQHAQLLNQSVLLKGINDQVEILASLSKKLFSFNVLPYYLHHLDSVSAALPFWLSKKSGYYLWQALQAELPGYLVPRYVEEIPGEKSKSFILEG